MEREISLVGVDSRHACKQRDGLAFYREVILFHDSAGPSRSLDGRIDLLWKEMAKVTDR